MRPAPFAYERVDSVADLVAALGDGGGDPAVLLAGGQSLVPMLNRRAVRPARVIDIDAVAELEYLGVDAGVRIGALCRHATIEHAGELEGPWAALRSAARHVALYPVRMRGTFGGSLAHADPAAELPLAAVTYDAEVTVRSVAGERRRPAAELLVGRHRTALAPSEAIVEVRLPRPAAGSVSAFAEVSRRALGWPLAAVCVVLRLDDGLVASAALGLGAAGPTPVRAAAAEELLVGRPLDRAAIDAAAAAAAGACGEAADDVDRDTRRDLVEELVRRTLRGLAAGAR